MQSDIADIDITAINIQLNELRSKFDQAMREGNDLLDLKETYLQMKELECHINALQWDPEKPLFNQYASVNPSWM
jgi:hypothetical protein